MKGNFQNRINLIFLFILISIVPSIYAQEAVSKIPELNGHVFPYFSNIRSPFTNTSINLNIGVGSADNLYYEITGVGGQPLIGLKGELLFANLSFQYQQRIRDWVALYVNGTLSTRLGTNVFSLISTGINTVSGTEIGWLFRLAHGKKYILSGSVEMTSYSGNFIDIRGFVEDLINQVPNPSISSDVPVLLGGAGLRFSYALNRVIGLGATGDLFYGESFVRGDEDLLYGLNGMIDLNFYGKYQVPIGLILTTGIAKHPSIVYTDQGFATISSLMINYTGTSDFLVGLDMNWMKIPIERINQDSKFLLMGLTMKYYFN